MPIELDASQSRNCCSPNGTIFPVIMGRAVVEKGHHDSFTTPFVVQSTDDTTLVFPCVAHLSTNSLASWSQDGFGKLFLQQVGEFGHGQPSNFLELVTQIMLELAFKRSGRPDSPSSTVVHLAEPDLEVAEEKSSCSLEEMTRGLTPATLILRSNHYLSSTHAEQWRQDTF